MKKVMTIIALALTLVSLAAVLSGCASAQAAREKIVISPKAAPRPEDTPSIVLSLGNGKAADSAAQANAPEETQTEDSLKMELAGAATQSAIENAAVLREVEEQSCADTSEERGTLHQGMESDQVEALQARLNDLGYLDSVTGYYGTDTEAAVAAFQEDSGLAADGIAGSETQMMIFAD